MHYGHISCAGCSIPVLRTSPATKRCKPCALAAHGETKDGFSQRVCVVCNAAYKPTGRSQKACGSCAVNYKNQTQKEAARVRRLLAGALPVGSMTNCADCGEDFEYRSGPQRRCENCKTERMSASNRDWRERNPDKARQTRARAKDQYDFGGNRSIALERDKHTCQHCGAKENLHVHHIDGKGTTTARQERNNELENLLTLCVLCHMLVHTNERKAIHAAPPTHKQHHLT